MKAEYMTIQYNSKYEQMWWAFENVGWITELN